MLLNKTKQKKMVTEFYVILLLIALNKLVILTDRMMR